MSSPILVVDSGVGGFSILQELLNLDPNQDYLYLADHAYFPYGDKDPRWLKERIRSLIAYGVRKGAQAVVLACNTATVHSLKDLRAEFALPIFGVEPVVKPLASYSSSAILTTSSTHSPKEPASYLQSIKTVQ
jgi:glutamate racemase